MGIGTSKPSGGSDIYLKPSGSGLSGETEALQEELNKKAEKERDLKQKLFLKSELGKPMPQDEKTQLGKFQQQLVGERQMVESTGQPLSVGGGGEYNPFADPFKVKELAAEKMEGQETGRLKAQQGMFGKAFIPQAESGKEPAKDAIGGSVKGETPNLHSELHSFADQKIDELLENNPLAMAKKSGFNTGINTNSISGY
jgi:hypothetical protein